MKKEQCTIGTVVKLKSGGPDMTVTSNIHNDPADTIGPYVNCSWFTDDETSPHGGFFPVAALDLETANEDED